MCARLLPILSEHKIQSVHTCDGGGEILRGMNTTRLICLPEITFSNLACKAMLVEKSFITFLSTTGWSSGQSVIIVCKPVRRWSYLRVPEKQCPLLLLVHSRRMARRGALVGRAYRAREPFACPYLSGSETLLVPSTAANCVRLRVLFLAGMDQKALLQRYASDIK